jgi:hypothetical protein
VRTCYYGLGPKLAEVGCGISCQLKVAPFAKNFGASGVSWGWVQRYAPELNKRIRREVKPTNGSWRTDETYVRVAGRWTYLYRPSIPRVPRFDFVLSETRDLEPEHLPLYLTFVALISVIGGSVNAAAFAIKTQRKVTESLSLMLPSPEEPRGMMILNHPLSRYLLKKSRVRCQASLAAASS